MHNSLSVSDYCRHLFIYFAAALPQPLQPEMRFASEDQQKTSRRKSLVNLMTKPPARTPLRRQTAAPALTGIQEPEAADQTFM